MLNKPLSKLNSTNKRDVLSETAAYIADWLRILARCWSAA